MGKLRSWFLGKKQGAASRSDHFTESFVHRRFGRFFRCGSSLREAWLGQLGEIQLSLNQPDAVELLEQLPVALAPWLGEVTLRVATDLLQHGNPRWIGMDVDALAVTLRPVALGALAQDGIGDGDDVVQSHNRAILQE